MKKMFIGFIFFINSGFLNAVHQTNFFSLCINEKEKSVTINPEKLTIDQKLYSKEKVSNFILKTTSQIEIPTIYHDRNNEVLMIVAAALPASKESMAIFAKMFPYYDVVLFDYRWVNQYGSFLMKSILLGKPVEKILLDPIEELKTVIDYFTGKKIYKKVVGLGECYGCFHLAKLQSDTIKKTGQGLFTHLILDSCWHSLRYFAERICYDPLLPVSPQDGGMPKIITTFTDNNMFKSVVLGFIFSFMQNISIKSYIASVEIPILFVHGKNDLFVPLNHFDEIWNATNKKNRAVFFTPYRHSDNLGNKKLYKYIVEQFVDSQSMHEFEKKF